MQENTIPTEEKIGLLRGKLNVLTICCYVATTQTYHVETAAMAIRKDEIKKRKEKIKS